METPKCGMHACGMHAPNKRKSDYHMSTYDPTTHPFYQDIKKAQASQRRKALLIGTPATVFGLAAAWYVSPAFPVVLFCLWAFSKAQGYAHTSARLKQACHGFLAQAAMMRECESRSREAAPEHTPDAEPDYDDADWWKKI